MNERTTAVVEGFKHLTNHEKIGAYIEIEEVWKAVQARPITPRRGPSKP